MGHCEMLLAVAGMSEADIRKLTAKLAKGDWSGFPADEQVALKFANKLTAKPAGVTDADVARLRRLRGLRVRWRLSHTGPVPAARVIAGLAARALDGSDEEIGALIAWLQKQEKK